MKLKFTEEKRADTEKKSVAVENSKGEYLGDIFYWKKWKCYIWAQDKDCIMSQDCLQQVIDRMKVLEKEMV